MISTLNTSQTSKFRIHSDVQYLKDYVRLFSICISMEYVHLSILDERLPYRLVSRKFNVGTCFVSENYKKGLVASEHISDIGEKIRCYGNTSFLTVGHFLLSVTNVTKISHLSHTTFTTHLSEVYSKPVKIWGKRFLAQLETHRKHTHWDPILYFCFALARLVHDTQCFSHICTFTKLY